MENREAIDPIALLTRLIVVVVALWGAVRLLETATGRDRPWTPLDLSAPLGRATAWKLASVADDPAWCRSVLRFDKVAFTPVPDRVTGPGCGWRGAVRLTAPEILPRGATMTCKLAVTLTVWEREIVRPAARARLGSNLAGMDHYGTYNCRAIAGTDRSSQHATANAIDIAAFHTVRGETVGVARDWQGKPAHAAFLRDIHDGACKLFGTTLGPDYNAAHRNHFHLDMAGWSYCR